MKYIWLTLLLTIALMGHVYGATGTIDPAGDGSYKALIENAGLGSATTVNFGKFTLQTSKNITVSNSELRGYAWGSGVGWIVMNCADTTSGCSATNGNFKVANDGSGNLSGYAWGENTGWINFGPFTDTSISTVKISGGQFGGTLGSAGYAWMQNYGWMKFDCSSPTSCVKTDWSATGSYQCNDGIDNDGDGFTDYPADPGCVDATDNNESNGAGGGGGGTPQCRDGLDNDGDGLIDYPADPGCDSANDLTEFNVTVSPYQCNDGIDNDGDGLIDMLDPGCFNPFDDDETNANTTVYACSDTIDNDSDGLIDYPADPGCVNASDNSEIDPIINTPMCNDGIDNDGDGLTDYPADPGCVSLVDTDESNPPVDVCQQNPNDPICVHQDFCDLYPNDLSCINNGTYCQTHPSECVPPKGPTRTDIVIGSAKQVVVGTVGTVAKIAGITAVGIGAGVAFLLANPFSLYDILLLLARLWSLLLVAFGLKKKANPWGTVYDSVTKQPIDPAYVVLMDMQGKEIATSITDIEGRYGFSVPAGTYQIMVNKTNYEFPSKKLADKTEDELYRDLYFGGPITITEEGGIIAKNIPLDQLGFDWNEYAKDQQRRLRMFKRRDVLIARVSNVFFIIGFCITGVAMAVAPSVLNGVLLGIYILMSIVRITGYQVRPKGSVTDTATRVPVPFSVVRIISNATNKELTHKVADARGTYYALVANGAYRVIVDRKNPDASYTPVSIPDTFEVHTGYLKQHFKV